MHMIKTIKPCGKTKQVCAQLNTINHFICQIMFIKDFILFLKHNKRPNLTSYLHPRIKLIDRRITKVHLHTIKFEPMTFMRSQGYIMGYIDEPSPLGFC